MAKPSPAEGSRIRETAVSAEMVQISASLFFAWWNIAVRKNASFGLWRSQVLPRVPEYGKRQYPLKWYRFLHLFFLRGGT